MTNTHTHSLADTAAAASTTTRTPSLGRFSGGSRQQIKHSVNHMTYWRLLQQIGVTIWRHYKRRQRRQRGRETRRNSDKTQHTHPHTLTHTHSKQIELKLKQTMANREEQVEEGIVRGSRGASQPLPVLMRPCLLVVVFVDIFFCLRLSPTSFDIIVVVSLPKATLQRTRCA